MALRLTNGLARIVINNEKAHEEKVFSAKFACPICNYSLTELEPRMFSFNNPMVVPVVMVLEPNNPLIQKKLSLTPA